MGERVPKEEFNPKKRLRRVLGNKKTITIEKLAGLLHRDSFGEHTGKIVLSGTQTEPVDRTIYKFIYKDEDENITDISIQEGINALDKLSRKHEAWVNKIKDKTPGSKIPPPPKDLHSIELDSSELIKRVLIVRHLKPGEYGSMR
ncbi:MAG: hypothetical protein J7L23_02415 [Candidatus Diapherotrites archaeon]|nr:hypothetical protein [Candidatus Diapherotrites archaeon]